jgi:TatD DNase family protein
MNSHNSCDIHVIDSHNHIHFQAFSKDIPDVIRRSFSTGVKGMLLVGIDPGDSLRALKTAQQYDGFYTAIGIHPQMAGKFSPEEVFNLEKLSHNPEVIAVGETGFDLFRTPETEKEQEDLFVAHIELSQKIELPLVIHDRDAHEKTIKVMDERNGWACGGVFHCFSGDVDLARKVLDNGFLVSIPGVVTYKNASLLKEIVRFCPLETLLVETDAPYLSPVPYRGKRNEPSYIQQTLKEIAHIKQLPFEKVARQTTENFKSLFLC